MLRYDTCVQCFKALANRLSYLLDQVMASSLTLATATRTNECMKDFAHNVDTNTNVKDSDVNMPYKYQSNNVLLSIWTACVEH